MKVCEVHVRERAGEIRRRDSEDRVRRTAVNW